MDPQVLDVPLGGASRNLSLYGLQLRSLSASCAGHHSTKVGWPAGSSLPPCLRSSACLGVMRRVASSASLAGSSCVPELTRAGCYQLPLDPLVYSSPHLADRNAARFFQSVACARLVPRDGCMCLPCYTTCRRSALCPTDPFSGARLSAPRLPEGIQDAYAYVVTLSLNWLFILKNSMAHWVHKYIRGVLRIALSLRDVRSRFPLVVIASNLTASLRALLRRANLTVHEVAAVPPPPQHRASRHVGTWNKLAAWRLTRYRRVISLDLDLVIRRNIDHLFSAAIGTPAATAEGVPPARDGSTMPFNTGLVVLTPSSHEFDEMMRAKDRITSYDGSEQGFLVSYFAGRRALAQNGSRGSAAARGSDDHAYHGVRKRWSELPRRYNLFQCVQSDEVEAAFVWHHNPNFHGGFGHEQVRATMKSLDARVGRLLASVGARSLSRLQHL